MSGSFRLDLFGGGAALLLPSVNWGRSRHSWKQKFSSCSHLLNKGSLVSCLLTATERQQQETLYTSRTPTGKAVLPCKKAHRISE